MMYNAAHRRGYTPATEGRSLAMRTYGCVQVYMCVRACVCRGVKKACNTQHVRASVHAGIVALLGVTPAPSLSLCNAIPRVRMYNGSAARESRRRAIYPLLFAFAGRQRTEETSTTAFVLHGGPRDRDRRSCFQFTTAITIACVALRFTHDRQFAFRIRNVPRDEDRRKV